MQPKNIKSQFLSTLFSRGFIHDCTDLEGLDAALKDNKILTAYVGYDATAESLHVGHLVNIMMLRWFQKFGGIPITLIGGGTTRVGDPSFRSEERPLLDLNEIKKNILSLKTIFKNFINYDKETNKALMLDNSDWLPKLNYLDFLRDYGKFFSINRMLSFESVKARLEREQSLSFLEFNYMLLQSYDFLILNNKYNCSIQFGGSDQWGNIVSGIELIRKLRNKKSFGLTTPLITTSDGKKMGKSQGKAVWLKSELLSPYEFWQFWRNTSDSDVEKFLLLYTEIPHADCKKYGSLKGSKINEAKILLANKVTELCHGKEASKLASKTATNVFSYGEADENLPTKLLSKKDLDPDIGIVQLYILSGLVKSGKEAKRLIKENGAKLNDEIIQSPHLRLTIKNFDNLVKLSLGKKNHLLIKIK
ncbi:MAG: tyrosine--tRNA ligase [Paracoccaceae bacterium]